MLSGRNYETLSLSFVAKRILFYSLETESGDFKEKAIKEFLLSELRHHLVGKTNITDAQNKITLKAVYLNPLSLKWLSAEEIKSTEKESVSLKTQCFLYCKIPNKTISDLI